MLLDNGFETESLWHCAPFFIHILLFDSHIIFRSFSSLILAWLSRISLPALSLNIPILISACENRFPEPHNVTVNRKRMEILAQDVVFFVYLLQSPKHLLTPDAQFRHGWLTPGCGIMSTWTSPPSLWVGWHPKLLSC